MPIDVSILRPQPLPQAPSLLDSQARANQLIASQSQMAMNALQLQKAQRESEQEYATNALLGQPGMINPETGEIDYGALMQAAPGYGLGSQVPKYAEMQLKQRKASREAEEAKFKAAQEEDKAASARMAEIRKLYSQVNSREGALALHDMTHRDPIVGPWLKKRGINPEEGAAKIRALKDEEVPGFLSQSSQSLDDVIKQTADSVAINDAWREAGRTAAPTTDTPIGEGREGRQVTTDKQSLYENFVDNLQTKGRLDLAEKWLKQNTELAMLPYAGLPPAAAELEALRRNPGLQIVKERLAELSAPKQIFNLGDKVQAKYGEALAGKVSQDDIDKMKAAEKAPDLATTADRILTLAQDPKLITGFGAEFRLNAARALNLVGMSDDETLRNTELLLSSIADQTLNAIEGSGLGSGQGFTNPDREFLQQARAGRLEFTRDTLARMARLARKAAEKSAERWNERRKRIPSEIAGSMGLPEEVIVKPFDPKAAKIDEELLGGPTGRSADPTEVILPNGQRMRFPTKKIADEYRQKFSLE